MSNNYELWVEKFGNEEMSHFIDEFNLTEQSAIFKFKPVYLLEKIDKEDLFSFGKYVGDFNKSNLLGYYSSLCNNFYQSKNHNEIEVENEESETINMIWDNVQDISGSLFNLTEFTDSFKQLSESIEDMLKKMSNKKIEKNAKYYQLEDVKEYLHDMSFQIEQLKLNKQVSLSEKTNMKGNAVVMALLFFIGFVLGGVLI